MKIPHKIADIIVMLQKMQDAGIEDVIVEYKSENAVNPQACNQCHGKVNFRGIKPVKMGTPEHFGYSPN